MALHKPLADKGSKKELPVLLASSGLPDCTGACEYAADRLKRELPNFLQYHTLYHTQSDVVPAIERLASLEQIEGEPLLLLRTAAYFHDIGFVVQTREHEEISKQIAAEILPRFRFTRQQIENIQALIATTRLPQTPRTLLDQIMADADLDVLGRPDFLSRNQALRSEVLALGFANSDAGWYSGQLSFLAGHTYFTRSARLLRDAQKRKNIAVLEQLLRTALTS